jgi:hypothetical protein
VSALPHDPDPARLAREKTRVEEWLTAHRADERAAAPVARHLLLRAALAHAAGRKPADVMSAVSEGVAAYVRAFELDARITPWEMGRAFLAAVAVRDESAAHFLAVAPEDRWAVRTSLLWPVLRNRFLHSFLRDLPVANDALEMLRAQPIPPGFGEDVALWRSEVLALEALHAKNRDALAAAMIERSRLRAESWRRHGRHAPAGALDLEGMGVCALARRRGAACTVTSPYFVDGF